MKSTVFEAAVFLLQQHYKANLDYDHRQTNLTFELGPELQIAAMKELGPFGQYIYSVKLDAELDAELEMLLGIPVKCRHWLGYSNMLTLLDNKHKWRQTEQIGVINNE